MDGWIARMAAAQEKDGYLSTYFTCKEPDQKWVNLHKSHELYCAGHFFEAAVAYKEATGKRTMLDAAVKLADYINSVFGPEKRHATPGHEEIELALVKLYRATGEQRYLDLCRFFLDQRGTPERLKNEYEGKPLQGPEFGPKRNRPPEYQQDHKPVVDQREAVGHVVRAGYLYAGMTDVAANTGLTVYDLALKAIWQDVVSKKLYITGTMGTSQYHDEGFGDPYLLPNESAYCETCASVANLLWNHRMALLYADARYADMLELVLYNGFLSGVSLSGDRFFYRNSLASKGSNQRRPWLEPACCPSNISRLIPQLARYLYAVGDGALYVNQFVGSSGTVTVSGQRVRLTQLTQYPWDGNVEIRVDPEREQTLAIHVRIPGWAKGTPVPSDLYRVATDAKEAPTVTLTVNGKPQSLSVLEKGYACIRRTWKKDDVIALNLQMPVRRVYANPKLEADLGRVALMRGPLVYCLESADHTSDVQQVALPAEAVLSAERRSDLLGGITVLRAQGVSKEGTPVGLTAIPYYAWSNRGATSMAVWILEGRALSPCVPTSRGTDARQRVP